ncbi:MAG: hypothetical protein NC310_04350 [Roseburia sp.]|nr:hypothetical protein [Anaeroplasma bactoclasticum]MCM1196292.1 hypothetical protein [Roseburia sp.]MCM1557457.1 hypothetical protein [Anaeroplasma bactoclasticum]
MQKGDIVSRLSHNQDIIFIITEIEGDTAFLHGLYIRLVADSDISDLVPVDSAVLNRYKESKLEYEKNIIASYKKKIGHITGKILHLDSDPFYLTKCMNLYKSLGIYAYGVELNEQQMAEQILGYIQKIRPNIIVLTGHDSYNNRGLDDLRNYKNTINFIKAVLRIRSQYDLDDICIYAGACGSNAESLIAAGANFASSFDRKNIEAFDPAIVAIMVAITPFNQIVDIENIYNFSKMQKGSIGGIESYGKMRLLVR